MGSPKPSGTWSDWRDTTAKGTLPSLAPAWLISLPISKVLQSWVRSRLLFDLENGKSPSSLVKVSLNLSLVCQSLPPERNLTVNEAKPESKFFLPTAAGFSSGGISPQTRPHRTTSLRPPGNPQIAVRVMQFPHESTNWPKIRPTTRERINCSVLSSCLKDKAGTSV